MAVPLNEIRGVHQTPGEAPKRWFSCPDADLYVWLRDGEIEAFELCYHKAQDEHVVSWRRGGGLRHARVDDGEEDPRHNRTPILVADGVLDPGAVALIFEGLGMDLEPRIYRHVLRTLLRACPD
jgi:hypothetical protein